MMRHKGSSPTIPACFNTHQAEMQSCQAKMTRSCVLADKNNLYVQVVYTEEAAAANSRGALALLAHTACNVSSIASQCFILQTTPPRFYLNGIELDAMRHVTYDGRHLMFHAPWTLMPRPTSVRLEYWNPSMSSPKVLTEVQFVHHVPRQEHGDGQPRKTITVLNLCVPVSALIPPRAFLVDF